MVETIEGNTYFKNVVKDAIKEIMKCDLDISYDGTLYKVSIKRGK